MSAMIYYYHKILAVIVVLLFLLVLGLAFSPDFTREATGAAVTNAKPLGEILWQGIVAIKNIAVGTVDLVVN